VRRALPLLALAVLAGGCAGVAEVTGTATQDDLVQLRADVAALQTSVRQMRTQLDTLTPQAEGRLRQQAVESERQAVGLRQQVDGLATTVTTLSTRVDDLNARVEALNRQLRGGTPAPAPTAPLTTAPPPAPAPPAQATARPTAPSPAPPAGARSATGALQPQDLYQAAYIDFSRGSYALAVTGFREFLRRYPDHELAANAQYWIGEAHLGLARGYVDAGQTAETTKALQQAVQEFRKVLANYPRGDKAPAALYKEALTLIELKQPTLAQARLQYLVDNFPQAEETPLARERLAVLKER
jgi:tol-pal system protein YbgF